MIELAAEGAKKAGVSADIWNPFCLSPLDFEPIIASVKKTGRLLVVQESNEIAGLGDRFVSLAVRSAYAELKCKPAMVSSPCVPVPFAPELEALYRPDIETVHKAILTLMGDHR
jgi:pyruvate dehydrogenase E1 component beta subunit